MSQDVELVVSDVVVLIDREQGGESRLASNNLKLHSAFTLTYILEASTDLHPDLPLQCFRRSQAQSSPANDRIRPMGCMSQ